MEGFSFAFLGAGIGMGLAVVGAGLGIGTCALGTLWRLRAPQTIATFLRACHELLLDGLHGATLDPRSKCRVRRRVRAVLGF